jgi:putative FmdB family regulatory protein
MPIYEYECRGCSERFELLVLKGSVAECPRCHGQDLEQLLSGFAVSSETSRQANALSSRREQVASAGFKEKRDEHAEYVRKHAEEDGAGL